MKESYEQPDRTVDDIELDIFLPDLDAFRDIKNPTGEQFQEAKRLASESRRKLVGNCTNPDSEQRVKETLDALEIWIAYHSPTFEK